MLGHVQSTTENHSTMIQRSYFIMRIEELRSALELCIYMTCSVHITSVLIFIIGKILLLGSSRKKLIWPGASNV